MTTITEWTARLDSALTKVAPDYGHIEVEGPDLRIEERGWDAPEWETEKGTDGCALCPVTLVCLAETGKRHPATDWKEAARDLKLNIVIAREIVDAADLDFNPDDGGPDLQPLHDAMVQTIADHDRVRWVHELYIPPGRNN